MKSLIKRRTVAVGRLKTSVSLEDEFWKSLREVADKRGETLSHLVATIDRSRRFDNLSSAIRLFILEFYKDQAGNRAGEAAPNP
jgi:predicted DNA-binding ribbon-helix-helix protein